MQVSGYLKLSVAVALATIAMKGGAWWLTGSVSLLSDALESLVNLAGASFALLMVNVAAMPADNEHPYGHHKAEYFSAGFEGILIVGASLTIIWAAMGRFLHPQTLAQLDWGLGLSLLSTALNGLLALIMLRAARLHRSSALEGDARHLLTDVWTSVGVVLGLIAAQASGWLWLDPLVAVGVALNILKEGLALVWRSAQSLMDEALEPADLARIEAVLQEHHRASAGAMVFDNLTTRRAGSRSFAQLHMHLPADWTLGRAADSRQAVEAALMQSIPGLHATIELLPQGQATAFEQSHQSPNTHHGPYFQELPPESLP